MNKFSYISITANALVHCVRPSKSKKYKNKAEKFRHKLQNQRRKYGAKLVNSRHLDLHLIEANQCSEFISSVNKN